MEEAESHARKGIDVIARLPDSDARGILELELQIVLGNALQATRGLTAPEVAEAYERARAICVQVGRPAQLASVLWGLSEFRLIRMELDLAEQLAAEMRQLGEKENNTTYLFLARHTTALSHAFRGQFSRSRAYFEEGLQYPPPAVVGTYARVGSLINLARVLLFLGHLDQARARYDEGLALARKSNPFTLALGLVLAGWFRYRRSGCMMI